ncbi:MAG: DNA repair protein RecN [Inquilinaceae bacterium]
MLVGLTIRDVVLIDRLTVTFDDGLAALTGETGAGKSILLDALGLALGRRGDAGLVRRDATAATVTAAFAPPPDHPALGLLADQDIAVDVHADDGLLLRRTVNADGRSRAFVNDQPVSIGLLRQIGDALVEIHGQFDTQGLLNPQTHRDLLDAFGGLDDRTAAVATLWRAWREAEQRRDEAARSIDQARAEEDFLRHAVAELDSLEPVPGEAAATADRRAMLMHREKLMEAISAALESITGERGGDRALGRAMRDLQRIADKAAGRLDVVLDTLDRALAETAEAAAALHSLIGDMDVNPRELEALDERLFALRTVARKHDVEVDALADLRTALADRLTLIEDQGDLLTRLTREATAARTAYVEAGEALGAARREAAARLDPAVAAELPPLKLDKARFVTRVEPLAEADWGPAGQDRVAFLVATNPGAAPGPLNKIASGGELARFTLALKVVLSSTAPVPTLVFDEVDSGISGAVADAVGERLARLGRRLQVLVVTHSPQVAARAASHWRVEKVETAGSATTRVVRLEAAERREEIARMLSGARITDQARAAADSLMAAQP